MSTVRPPLICDRVRSQISLELDGELSQLDRAMVAAHLEQCADCRAYRGEVTAFTSVLRAAPLEEMEKPVVVRRQRRAIAARLQVGAAAAIAIAALGAASQVVTTDQSPAGSPAGSDEIRYPSLRSIEREQAILESVNSGKEIRLVLDGLVL